jgi:RNA polymerase sigma-70 factor (ECF subfamily)
VRVVRPRASSDAPPSLDALEDSALIEWCRQGRRDAFDLLVQRHQRSLYQVCYRFVANHADASDLVQESFLRAWRGLPGFKKQSSVGTWLYRIAVNACLNRLAAKTPSMEGIDAQLVDDAAEGASERMLRRERALAVRRAILALPDRQRATVILRMYHDLPHQEIADILGSSVGSVKANLFHGLRNLRRLLGGARL